MQMDTLSMMTISNHICDLVRHCPCQHLRADLKHRHIRTCLARGRGQFQSDEPRTDNADPLPVGKPAAICVTYTK